MDAISYCNHVNSYCMAQCVAYMCAEIHTRPTPLSHPFNSCIRIVECVLLLDACLIPVAGVHYSMRIACERCRRSSPSLHIISKSRAEESW